jgi:hypothetical protein
MDKKPTKAGATKPKKRINFKVVEPKTKPKPKMEEKKKIKFVVTKKEKKKNIKFIVKKKEEPKPVPKKNIKFRLKENAVEHDAFAGLNIKEAIKEHGINTVVDDLLDMFRYPRKFIKGYREYSETEKKRIKKNLKESITIDTQNYKEFADKFKVKEPEFFKYMENHFKDVERPKTSGESIVNKTKEEMNKMDPLELFGKLPDLVKLKILDPKTTGIKVGKTPPLPKELANTLNSVVDNILSFKGFHSYFNSWTYYEGGNFKKGTHEYFEKKADQLNKHSYDEIISDLFEKYTKLPAVIKSTIREYNMTSMSDYIDRLIESGETPRYNEEWKYYDDYEDYNVEYRYGLTYEDGDFYTTNKTKSKVNSLVKDVNDESKREKKVAKQLAKDIEKFMKENKLN